MFKGDGSTRGGSSQVQTVLKGPPMSTVISAAIAENKEHKEIQSGSTAG